MSDLEIIKKIENKYKIQLEKVGKVGKVSFDNTKFEYSINSLNQVDGLTLNWIEKNYNKYEDDIYEIMGVTNTKQFRN